MDIIHKRLLLKKELSKMQSNACLSPLVFGLAVAVSLPTHAAEAVALQAISFEQLQHMFHLELPGSLPHVSPAQADSLQFLAQHIDKKNITHVRVQQEYAGFPVFGGYGIIHGQQTGKALLRSSRAVPMTGTVYHGLDVDLGKPDSTFVAKADVALQQFKARYSNQTILEEQVIPMVYVDEQNRAFWAYKVSVLVQPADNIPERPTAILDAQTFKPFIHWNDVKTSRSIVQGQGYGGNARIGAFQYGVDLPFLQLTRDSATGICYMRNKDVKVFDMRNDYSMPSSTMAIDCEMSSIDDGNTWWTGYRADGYDQRNGAYSPTNDALYIGSVIKTMYRQWYDLDVLTSDNKPMPLVMRVHYGKGYENAFWDGKQMTFGDGGATMYPLVSLGVGAHEISHGFTEQHAGLNYFGQSGGMNESFSDMAAQAAEFYVKNESSWDIGHDIMKESSGYRVLRYMDKPSRDGRSIDRADEYRQNMNVHYSSGVYNRLFYLLATQPDWDVRQAFHVMLKANLDYWMPNSNFEQGACGVLSAAKDLDLSVDAVKLALDGVRIDYRKCVV